MSNPWRAASVVSGPSVEAIGEWIRGRRRAPGVGGGVTADALQRLAVFSLSVGGRPGVLIHFVVGRPIRWGVRVHPLSDGRTKVFKLRFVGMVGAIAVAITLAVGVFREPRATLLMMGFMLVGVITVVAWSVRRYPWALADEVVDEGNCLVVRRRPTQARVSFDDIVGIDRDAMSFARNVRLTLARPIPSFGNEVVFRPRDSASMTTHELNRLIDELRARAPAAALQDARKPSDSRAAVNGWASHRTLAQKRVISRLRRPVRCARCRKLPAWPQDVCAFRQASHGRLRSCCDDRPVLFCSDCR